MPEVVVLGGYGRLGTACVRELLETTKCGVVIAGPSVQRAEWAALSFGERTRGAYANATDPRTIGSIVADAAAILACSTAPPLAALELALEARVPFVALSSLEPAPGSLRSIAERAWAAQVPIVLHAGAVPGLPGVCAEFLVRRFDHIRRLRVASTGPCASRISAWATARGVSNLLRRSLELRFPQRIEFPRGVDRRWVSRARTPELAGFAESNCVDELDYLESARSLLALGTESPAAAADASDFAVVAEAFVGEERSPAARIGLRARDLVTAAGVAGVTLVRAILAGSVPNGLLAPHEALNPGLYLHALAKRGIAFTQS